MLRWLVTWRRPNYLVNHSAIYIAATETEARKRFFEEHTDPDYYLVSIVPEPTDPDDVPFASPEEGAAYLKNLLKGLS